MEHKLVLGGDEYLPFARSRIKALRATGLKYASQAFDAGGALVRVRIAGDQEYIEIDGGGGYMQLDSGVVEVYGDGRVRPLTGEKYLPGKLYESTRVAAYNAAFSVPSSQSAKWSGWRSNAGQAPHHQLSGVVLAGANSFTGHVLPDLSEAASFAPLKIEVAPPTDPRTARNYASDSNLAQKKVAGVACPASIFTGRCRLYVQAMYGQPLYDYASVGAGYLGEALAVNAMSAEYESGGTPLLMVAAYVKEGQQATHPPVPVTTSSGVHLDTASGRHFLFCISTTGTLAEPAGTVSAYPLAANRVCERLRKYLKTTQSLLSAEDIEHLEAYILSRSRPDVAKRQVIGSIGALSTYSMGYGWHWNRTGLVADIVYNATKDVVPFVNHVDDAIMESTHHRMTVGVTSSVDETTKVRTFAFTLVMSIISPPTKWAVPRGIITIAEPDWGGQTLSKATPRHTVLSAFAPVTFYAFYKGDDLQLCTVGMEEVAYVPASFTCTPPEYDVTNSAPGQDISLYGIRKTLGMHGGSGLVKRAQPAYHIAAINCGGVVHSGLMIGRQLQGSQSEVGSKTFVVTGEGVDDGGLESPNSQGGEYAFGYPDADGNYQTGVNPDLRGVAGRARGGQSGRQFYAYYTATESEFTELYEGTSAVVIPFYDAEAVFIKSKNVKYRSESGIIVSQMRSLTFAQSKRYIEYYNYGTVRVIGPWIHQFYWDNNSNSQQVSSSNPGATLTTTVTFDSGSLICGAGTKSLKDFTLDSSFWTFADEVLATFDTLTSAAGAVVITQPEKLDPVGIGAAIAMPILVGWT